jgi:hypothetical protein
MTAQGGFLPVCFRVINGPKRTLSGRIVADADVKPFTNLCDSTHTTFQF